MPDEVLLPFKKPMADWLAFLLGVALGEQTPDITGRDVTAARRADLGGNLDRQSHCRYRDRTAARLAAGEKQALASLTSLCLAGRASIAAALRFHAAAQIAHCKRS